MTQATKLIIYCKVKAPVLTVAHAIELREILSRFGPHWGRMLPSGPNHLEWLRSCPAT